MEQIQPRDNQGALDGALDKCGPVSFDEARQIAQRFIDGHFNNAAEHARMSIPADPRRDDDLRLIAFIRQQRLAAAATKEERAKFYKDVEAGLIRDLELSRNIEASLRRELAASRANEERLFKALGREDARWTARIKALEARLEHIGNIAGGHAVVDVGEGSNGE
jgi:hypothetical protein